MPRPLRLDRRGRLVLSEADVARKVSDWMQLHGWREFVTGYGEIRDGERVVARVGEVGMPDRLYIQYSDGFLVWVELKRAKGGRHSIAQKNWIRDERIRGAEVWSIRSLDELKEKLKEVFGRD
jgi:hypothetical protein